jgi:hypothetical protein
MEDPRGKRAFAPFFQPLTAQMQAFFGGAEGIGLDTMGFLMEMPLLDILLFQENALPKSPEDLVDGLLAQVSQNN